MRRPLWYSEQMRNCKAALWGQRHGASLWVRFLMLLINCTQKLEGFVIQFADAPRGTRGSLHAET